MPDKITIGNPRKGERGPGRPKGSPNKVTKAAKDLIAEAAEKLGGIERLVAWAEEAPENEKAFWSSIYPKLIPVQLSGDPDNPLTHIHEIGLVPGARRS